jgi:hypothetical protein
MNPKELAAKYEAKIFDSASAAEAAGFVLTETYAPRNIWNKMSAAQVIISKLVQLRKSGEAAEIGLVNDGYSVSGCYKKTEAEP